MATAKGAPKEPDEKGTTEVSPGSGGVSQDVSSAGGGEGVGGEPVSDDVKQAAVSGQPVEGHESTVSTQVTPIPGVPEDRPAPGDWTPPGDWKKGFYPGDPNVYPDPENPTASY